MSDHTEDAQHTPGPWRVSGYDGGWTCIRDDRGQIIAKLGLNVEANGHLIASAPALTEENARLVAAAKTAMQYLTDKHCDGEPFAATSWAEADAFNLYWNLHAAAGDTT